MSSSDKIFILDKNEKSRRFLSRFLEGFSLETRESSSLSEAVNILFKSSDFALALISQAPVEENFIQLLQSLKTYNPHLGIILLTEIENKDFAISLLENGTIDHITSPNNLTGIFSAVKNELHKRELIRKNDFFQKKLKKLRYEQELGLKKALDLEEVHNTTLENLMTALDLRDVETFGHSRTVAKYSQVLAQVLGIKDKVHLDQIRKGALLHDVGKIAIPDSILKKASSLSSNEWEKIKLHPALGFGLIKEIKLVKEVGDIILYHHERYDGTGYPYNLKKEKIPLEARIFALADALDAITSKRPYREKRDFRFAKKEIELHSGTQFDPEVAEAFCSLSMEKWAKIRFETTKLMPHFEEILQIYK